MLGLELARVPRAKRGVAGAIVLLGLASCDPALSPLGPGVPIVAPPPPADLCVHGTLSRGTFTDLGFPAEATPPGDHHMAVAARDSEVLVGTGDGVWRRPIDGSGGWERSGLDGRQVRYLLPILGSGYVLAATGTYGTRSSNQLGSFHRSEDGGHSWLTGGRFTFEDIDGPHYIPMTNVVRQPGPEGDGIGVLYANVTGASIVRSSDGGANWEYLLGSESENNSEFWHDGCAFHIPAWADRLDIGCRTATVGFFSWIDISSRSGPLGQGHALVPISASLFDETDDPAMLTSASQRPEVVLAAHSRGVVRLSDDTWTLICPLGGKAVDNMCSELGFRTEAPINTIWIDPCDPSHQEFGGGGPEGSFGLYETFDDGQTMASIAVPESLNNRGTYAGAPSGAGAENFVLLTALHADQSFGGPSLDDPSSYSVIVHNHAAQ